jgi:hypothetical protein
VLETPLFGRFGKENRRLVFGPTQAYDILVGVCTAGGAALGLVGLTGGLGIVNPPFSSEWCVLVGGLTFLAGSWAYLSLVRISFDIKNGTYWRRQGPGFITRVSHGTLADLDALVLIAEPRVSTIGGGVTYHLVLHWKNRKEPLMVVQQDTRSLLPGQPLQSGGQPLMQLGMQYAKALGIPFYDNSHFPSACPVPIF